MEVERKNNSEDTDTVSTTPPTKLAQHNDNNDNHSSAATVQTNSDINRSSSPSMNDIAERGAISPANTTLGGSEMKVFSNSDLSSSIASLSEVSPLLAVNNLHAANESASDFKAIKSDNSSPFYSANTSKSKGKNKQKHNESESRRRDRMRNRFNELRIASDCEKKDRIAILDHATQRFDYLKSKIRDFETQQQLLAQQLNLGFQGNVAATMNKIQQHQQQFKRLGNEGGEGEIPSGLLTGSQFNYLATLPTAFIGLDGKFHSFNPAFVQLSNYSVDQLLNITIFSLTHPNDLLTTFAQLKKLLSGEAASWENDRNLLTADGTIVSCHLTMATTKSSNTNKPLFFTCFFCPKEANSALAFTHLSNNLATNNLATAANNLTLPNLFNSLVTQHNPVPSIQTAMQIQNQHCYDPSQLFSNLANIKTNFP
jgi:PAS domain S-box-containing protein